MNTLKQFKVTLIVFVIWLVCFISYLVTSPGSGYAPTPEAARTLGGFMGECSGDVINYGAQGYRCDAYGPSKIATIIIMVGVIAFIVTLVTFVIRLMSRTEK